MALGRTLVELPLIRPMLATAGTRLPADPDRWAVEVKWDGVRITAYLDGSAGGLRLLTRNANQATERYPEAAELLDLLPRGTDAVFDGELIAAGPDGRPSFGRLQERMSLRRPAAIRSGARTFPVTLMLFDVLWLDGRSLVETAYRDRREVLESLPLDGHRVVVPPVWPGSEADAALEWTAQKGLEGVVAKRLASPYRPGVRSEDWIKFKHTKSLDITIGGWIPAGTTVKALLLGVRDGADLRYVGRVGAGFSNAEGRALVGLLSHLGADRSPFTAGPALPRTDPLRFVRPEVTGEVDYLDVTDAGLLAHPVWRGLRGAHAD
ncbi:MULTISPECIES: RNA ligase family protein [Streptacidiphilus]|uniref:DNA ligase (ATP) n=1 Tax=Streptacidiphilus cavernicola TaxID=3342716 RepID=A0ABV6UKS1_9ACTN|nr:RNA ligase family protein [Streptacidiphilus jeojiense]